MFEVKSMFSMCFSSVQSANCLELILFCLYVSGVLLLICLKNDKIGAKTMPKTGAQKTMKIPVITGVLTAKAGVHHYTENWRNTKSAPHTKNVWNEPFSCTDIDCPSCK